MGFGRRMLLVLITGLVLYFILSRLRLVVLIHVSLGQALLITAVVIGVLFLALDHLLFRSRSARDAD